MEINQLSWESVDSFTITIIPSCLRICIQIERKKM